MQLQVERCRVPHARGPQYKRVDAPGLTMEERASKLLLAGWISPDSKLVYREMERSLTRTDPRGSGLAIMFPDDGSHAAAMLALADYVREYAARCAYELPVWAVIR